jgi:hypothetical protein
MRVGNFSVIVPEGRERDSGHVELVHGVAYRPTLKNHHNNRRCDARVTIDGKDMGTFRVLAFGSFVLERPAHDAGRFTFYKADTAEYAAAACGEVAPDLRGLVQVVFRAEKVPAIRVGKLSIPGDAFDRQGSELYAVPATQTCSMPPAREAKTSGGIDFPDNGKLLSRRGGAGGQSVSAGATGLSGHSDQKFVDVAELDYDPNETVTITLRLVAADAGPRPLTATPRANPVPAPVG